MKNKESNNLGLTSDGMLDLKNLSNYENGTLKPEALEFIGLGGFKATSEKDGTVTYTREPKTSPKERQKDN